MISQERVESKAPRVVIVGGGFVGINAAKRLGRIACDVVLLDRRNHYLFQPLWYQVAMAGLSPADIAAPIRSMLSPYRNIRVLQGEAQGLDWAGTQLMTDFGPLPFDYLLLACGAQHSYFGHDRWEASAPGLKTVEQATEIRRRVLTAFEIAERNTDPEERQRQLTFVVIGGGPTGVELAGAIGQMTRFTLARDFRSIDSKLARIILIEAGPRTRFVSWTRGKWPPLVAAVPSLRSDMADGPHLLSHRLSQPLVVVMQWAWSYWTFRRGARLIVNQQWQLHPQRDSRLN